ncbi:MAG: hypothetical protein ACLUEK_10710 [Oscillospiraceae bacterium]
MLGLIRPRIYLPFGLDEGASEQVLTHERRTRARRPRDKAHRLAHPGRVLV